MSFMQNSSLDFEEDAQLYAQNFNKTRQPDFGPWVQPRKLPDNQLQKANEVKPRREANTAGFLCSSSGQRNQVRFNNKFNKQTSEDITEVNIDSKGTETLPSFRRACLISYPLPEGKANTIEGPRERQGPKKKIALNTTMYVYSSSSKKGSGQTSRSERVSFSEFCSADIGPVKVCANTGSSNLQRILRVKEKIRVKNNVAVRKLKEKMTQAEIDSNSLNMKEKLLSLPQPMSASENARKRNPTKGESKPIKGVIRGRDW